MQYFCQIIQGVARKNEKKIETGAIFEARNETETNSIGHGRCVQVFGFIFIFICQTGPLECAMKLGGWSWNEKTPPGFKGQRSAKGPSAKLFTFFE